MTRPPSRWWNGHDVADVPPLRVVVGRATVPVVPMNWLDRLYNTNPVVHYVVLGFAAVWYAAATTINRLRGRR